MNLSKINPPNWSYSEMSAKLKKFVKIYRERPIKKNFHGMRFNHMFALYFILLKIKPKVVIESGIFKGQSTWLIKKTLPKCKIFSFDIDLKNRIFISKKVRYFEYDLKYYNFNNFPKETLVFLDDHQNHLERLKLLKWIGFKHVVLEDNYPVGRGDFYTLRHAFSKKGFNHHLSFLNIIKTSALLLLEFFKKKINKNYFIKLLKINSRLRDAFPNSMDIDYLKKNIEIYYEFPPVAKLKKNKWGDSLENKSFRTEKSIYKYTPKFLKEFENEIKIYNYLTYLKLK